MIKRSIISIKTKKLIQIDNIDVKKILVSKRESSGTKSSFNTLLGIMIMMTQGNYI